MTLDLEGDGGGGGGGGRRRDDDAAIAAAIAAAERQQEAEDAFLLADTSGDGCVDEGELLALCASLLLKVMGAVDERLLARYLLRFRSDPATPLALDFDAFVGVYNSFLAEERSGRLAQVLMWL